MKERRRLELKVEKERNSKREGERKNDGQRQKKTTDYSKKNAKYIE